MTYKHTPGPWEWVPDGDFGSQLVHFYDRERCNYVVVCDDGSAAGEYIPAVIADSPDGRLIAAAPDLLAALEWVAKNGLFAHPTNLVNVAKEAVAKARGQV